MPKLLDNNGLSHLWAKFKEYLTSWKTTNFGTGTCNNRGSIANSGSITVDNNRIILSVGRHTETEASLVVWNSYVIDASNIDYYGTILIAGCTNSGGGIAIYPSENEDITYLAIANAGIKTGRIEAGSSSTTVSINIGNGEVPFLCVLLGT